MGGCLVVGALLSARARLKKMPADPNVPKSKPGELGWFKGGLKALPEAIAANLADRLKLNWYLTEPRSHGTRNLHCCILNTRWTGRVFERSIVLSF